MRKFVEAATADGAELAGRNQGWQTIVLRNLHLMFNYKFFLYS